MPHRVKHQTASQHLETVTLFGQACGPAPVEVAQRQRFECFSLHLFSDREQKVVDCILKADLKFFLSVFNTRIEKIEISIRPTRGFRPVFACLLVYDLRFYTLPSDRMNSI